MTFIVTLAISEVIIHSCNPTCRRQHLLVSASDLQRFLFLSNRNVVHHLYNRFGDRHLPHTWTHHNMTRSQIQNLMATLSVSCRTQIYTIHRPWYRCVLRIVFLIGLDILTERCNTVLGIIQMSFFHDCVRAEIF